MSILQNRFPPSGRKAASLPFFPPSPLLPLILYCWTALIIFLFSCLFYWISYKTFDNEDTYPCPGWSLIHPKHTVGPKTSNTFWTISCCHSGFLILFVCSFQMWQNTEHIKGEINCFWCPELISPLALWKDMKCYA